MAVLLLEVSLPTADGALESTGPAREVKCRN